jgi:hypothetical protein
VFWELLIIIIIIIIIINVDRCRNDVDRCRNDVDRCRNPRRQECDSKRSREILKYKDLTIEIQRMWNVKTRVIPVMIGATGTISKPFRKYVSTIPGNHEVKELQ